MTNTDSNNDDSMQQQLTILDDSTVKDLKNYSKYLNEHISIENIHRDDFGYDDWIPLEHLRVDETVQRSLMEKQVKRIMTTFTPSSFGRITVSKREDGFYYVQNGQHRIEALKRLGFKEAPCIVVDTCNIKEEAVNFIKINENSAVVKPIDKYRIGISAEDDNWLRVKHILDYCELKPSTNPTGGVSALASIYKYVNSPTLITSKDAKAVTMRTSLNILKSASTIDSITHTSMLAMCIFTREYIETDTITEAQAIEKFKDVDVKGLVKVAQTMKQNASRGRVISYLAWLFFSEYNKGIKRKLPVRIQP